MKKCVEALDQAAGDVEAAVDILRKAGVAAAAKKAGRGTTEGAAAIAHGPDGAAVVEVNSETDFVARNEIFQALCSNVARTALLMPAAADGSSDAPTAPLDPAALGAAPLDGGDGTSVTEAVGVAVSQLGENLVLRRGVALRTPPAGGVVATYVHNAYAPNVGKTAAAVVLSSGASDVEALRSLGQKLAMHVVASQPLFLSKESVDPSAVQRERDVLLEQAQGSGKKPEVIEKMVNGRLNKYYQEVCLLEQTFLIEEGAGSVAKVLAAAGKELGAPVELAAFARYQVGEAVGAAEGA